MTPDVVVHIANALHGVRQLLEWGGYLRAPDAKGKKPAPLIKLNAQALPTLHSVNEELRATLCLLGEEPGWSALHADAIVMKCHGYEHASKFAAPPPIAPSEALDRIAQLEAENAGLKKDVAAAWQYARKAASEQLAAERTATEAEARAKLATPVEDALWEAAEVTNSHDPWRELGRFAEFCNRITYAGEVPNLIDPNGPPVGPCMRDDPTLPVFSWVRAEERGVPSSISEAAALYVAWQREACAIFMESQRSGAGWPAKNAKSAKAERRSGGGDPEEHGVAEEDPQRGRGGFRIQIRGKT